MIRNASVRVLITNRRFTLASMPHNLRTNPVNEVLGCWFRAGYDKRWLTLVPLRAGRDFKDLEQGRTGGFDAPVQRGIAQLAEFDRLRPLTADDVRDSDQPGIIDHEARIDLARIAYHA